MSQIRVPMTLPLDSDGFLRRECPDCEREFKWRPTQGTAGDRAEQPPAPDAYYCPYCYEAAAPNKWLTKAQVQLTLETGKKEAVEPLLRGFLGDMKSLERPGGSLRVEINPPVYPEPTPLAEPDDMVRVNFPCHPDEPIKVDDGWERDYLPDVRHSVSRRACSRASRRGGRGLSMSVAVGPESLAQFEDQLLYYVVDHTPDYPLSYGQGVGYGASDVDAEQEGFHQLFRGVVGAFKNPSSHRVIATYTQGQAIAVVRFVDLLLGILAAARDR